MKIVEIEGIGPSAAASLGTAGVTTTEALLDRGATAAGRRELAKSTGLSADLILQWVNHCDLMRLRGVGSEYSDLLEAAGVDSPTELAQRNPANLAQKIQDVVDGQPGIVRRVPTQHEIAVWIEEAKTLPKLVSHGGAGHGAGAGATGTAVGATGTAVGAGGTQSEATLGNPDSGSKPAGATKPASGTGSANTASATRPTNGSGVIAGSQATADGARREVGSAQAAMTSAATSATPTSLGDTTAAVSSAAVSSAAGDASRTAAEPTRSAAPIAAIPAAPPSDDGSDVVAERGGLWSRIKRMFGSGQ